MILAPREQILVPFGPLTSGGLVHARIHGEDALEADNDRYAYAPVESHAHVLVLSPDAAVRDDLARVLLAVNSNFIITTADPAQFKGYGIIRTCGAARLLRSRHQRAIHHVGFSAIRVAAETSRGCRLPEPLRPH